jgi:hypothetical protein
MFHKILAAIDRIPSGEAPPTEMSHDVFKTALDFSKFWVIARHSINRASE